MKTPRLILALIIAALASGLRAQTPAPDYGAPIPLADAKRALAAAQAEAVKNKWNVAIAIVDSGGHLVAY